MQRTFLSSETGPGEGCTKNLTKVMFHGELRRGLVVKKRPAGVEKGSKRLGGGGVKIKRSLYLWKSFNVLETGNKTDMAPDFVELI